MTTKKRTPARKAPSAAHLRKTISTPVAERAALTDAAPRGKQVATVRPGGLVVGSVRDAKRASGTALLDGFVNIYSSMGVIGKDSAASTRYVTPPPLGYGELEGIFRFDGLGRRIIEIPVREMTRREFTVKGDDDGVMVKYLKARGFMKQLRFLIRWSRLYGGAIGVILVDEAGKEAKDVDLSIPLDPSKIKNLKGMNVYDRWRTTFTLQDLHTNPKEPDYMWPRYYYVQPIGLGQGFYVHESRVIRMDGAPIPEIERQGNNYWMDSVLQAPYVALRKLMAAFGMSDSILTDFVQGVFAMSNLGDLIAAGNDEEVIRRMEVMRLFKSNTNTMPIDKEGESYTKVTSTLTGVPDLLSQYWKLLSGVMGWPEIILQGTAPGGLSGSGDSQFQSFYDNMSEERADIVGPFWERLVKLAYQAKEGPTRGVVPADFVIEFPPLSEPSEKEQAEIEKTRAETDHSLIADKVISPLESRSRLGGGDPGNITLGDFEAPNESPEPPVIAPPAGTGAQGDPVATNKKKPTKASESAA